MSFPCCNKRNFYQHKFGALHPLSSDTLVQSCKSCKAIQTTVIKDGKANSVITLAPEPYDSSKNKEGLNVQEESRVQQESLKVGMTSNSVIESMKSHNINADTGKLCDKTLDPGT